MCSFGYVVSRLLVLKSRCGTEGTYKHGIFKVRNMPFVSSTVQLTSPLPTISTCCAAIPFSNGRFVNVSNAPTKSDLHGDSEMEAPESQTIVRVIGTFWNDARYQAGANLEMVERNDDGGLLGSNASAAVKIWSVWKVRW